MLPRFRAGAFAVFALAFLVTMLLGDRSGVAAGLSLEADAFLQGRALWAPASALLRYPEGLGLMGLLLTLVTQWIVGSRLEGFWGTTRYLVMVLVSGLVAYAGVAGLGLFIPAVRAATFSGASPLDAAAVLAFAVVFGGETMHFGERQIAPRVLAAVLGVLVIAFPVVAGLASGMALGAAWPLALPPLLAMGVAAVFVQPWRKRESSGKVERSKQRSATHLRVVRSADDMLN